MCDKKYNMLTRDWVYLLVLSIILQFIIYFLAFVYNSSTNALGYVSFAGTMISIILAIIAIGYTYGESIRQKHNEDELIIQIRGLSEIKEKLGDQVDVLENIASLKQSVDEKLDASHRWIVENINKYENSEKIDTGNFGTPSVTILETNLKYLSSTNYVFDIYVIYLYKSMGWNKTGGFVKFIDNLFDQFKILEKNERSAYIRFEASMAVWSILKSLDLIEDEVINFNVSKFYKEKYKNLDELPSTELKQLIQGL
jgi:hypothetical protein